MFPELMNRVEIQLSQGLPFVIYRKPNSRKVKVILQKDDQLHHTFDFTEKGFVFAPYDTNGPVVLIPVEEELNAQFTARTLPKIEVENKLQDNTQEKEVYLDLVKQGIQNIQKGHIDKVVLSRKITIDFAEPPLKIFEKLISTYSDAFCYLWYHPKIGMWLGATPEILLRAENNSLTTMSLAGTQPFAQNNYPEWGQKEQDEQLMVTNYISNILQGHVTKINVHEVEPIRAGSLWHLRTKITATFDNNLDTVIKALHPTPAVCGIPLVNAQDFIGEHENYNREYYTGFLGELNFEDMIERNSKDKNLEIKSYRTIKSKTELYVNLRCMQMDEGKAIIYVGGGITKDSIPEDEWKETVAKSKTIMGVLAKDRF